MVIGEKMQKAINKQINAELYSSYLYLSMAAYFESLNLAGFAHWMKAQAAEENNHAMKFFGFICERGGRVILSSIDSPKTDWKSPVEAFEDTYNHELKVTELINSLMALAKTESDYATASMLQWFIDEQVEEEQQASLILEKLRMIKDSSQGLLMLDKQLGERK